MLISPNKVLILSQPSVFKLWGGGQREEGRMGRGEEPEERGGGEEV